MKKLIRFLTSRLFIFAFLIILQMGILALSIVKLQELSVYFYMFCQILSLVVVFFIIGKDDNPNYKIAWIIPIMAFPVFGGVFYLFFGRRGISKKVKKILKTAKKVKMNEDILSSLKENPEVYKQASYISGIGYPIYRNTETSFLSPGEKFLEILIAELKKAKKFIYLEFFIIEEGVFWNQILDILTEKVKEGVDVRVMYDDMGCIKTLPDGYVKKLKKLGIKAKVFNPFVPSVDLFMNNRDHRKICVIDGNVGFTGGINLADEYINEKPRFGHWKDAGIMLKGEAVLSLTSMFLHLWGSEEKRTLPDTPFATDGYVMPFSDMPIDRELTGENIYLNMINSAKTSIFIETPYLIIDNEMLSALCLAAKSGIKVIIVTPGIPDKWFVHEVTRSNYKRLIESGVNVYEYKNGFIHSKIVITDRECAVIGTQNFDYRSLYLHFECGVWMYKSKAVYEADDDFKEIIKVSKKIEKSDLKIPWYKSMVRGFLKLFSPLL